MGYGSSLYALKKRYGSPEALEVTDKLCKYFVNKVYQSSSYLAKEKGSFKVYDQERYLKSQFIKNALTKETVDIIKKNGIRNSHLTTTAPTGNTAIYANNVSGGLEPVISHNYVRTVICNFPPEGLEVPKEINWDHQTYKCSHDNWKWVMEGAYFILRKEFNGSVYKIDQSRGLCKEEEVSDYAVLTDKEFDPKAEYAATLYDLDVYDHVNTMAVFAKYVDSAISKTVNVPNDYPFEDFKSVYTNAYDTGVIKGITTYRMGTMTFVVKAKDEKVVEVKKEDSSIVNGDRSNNQILEVHAPSRPKAIPCHIYRIMVSGEQWIVFVGILSGKPYEVLAGKVGNYSLPSSIHEGNLVKIKRGIYSFEYDGEVIVKNITEAFSNDTYEAMTRLISTSLRHGVPIEYIVEQLQKSKGVITDFSKSVIRAIKKYIPDNKPSTDKCPSCGGNMIFLEGCVQCAEKCGFSKCG